MKKKGSLALSTNAIVVLIIAITILGLALTFTRGIFGTLGENVAAVGKGELLDKPPNLDNPMTLSRTEVEVRIENKVKLKVAWFNKYSDEMEPELEVHSCVIGDDSDTEDDFQFTIPPPVEVDINKDVTFPITIEPKKTAKTGTYICTFMIDTTSQGGEKLYEGLYISVN